MFLDKRLSVDNCIVGALSAHPKGQVELEQYMLVVRLHPDYDA